LSELREGTGRAEREQGGQVLEYRRVGQREGERHSPTPSIEAQGWKAARKKTTGKSRYEEKAEKEKNSLHAQLIERPISSRIEREGNPSRHSRVRFRFLHEHSPN